MTPTTEVYAAPLKGPFVMDYIRTRMAQLGVPWYRVKLTTTWRKGLCGMTATGRAKGGELVVHNFLVLE